MTTSRAKLWLRVIGALCIILVFVGLYLQTSATLDQVRDQTKARMTANTVRLYHIFSVATYIALLLIFISGLAILQLLKAGPYLLILTSVYSLLISSTPCFFFAAPRFLDIDAVLSFDLEEITGYSVGGIIPFVVSLIPFWGTSLSLLCYRSLHREPTDENNEKAFNKAIEPDRE